MSIEEVTPRGELTALLPGAQFMDAYCLELDGQNLDARAAAVRMMARALGRCAARVAQCELDVAAEQPYIHRLTRLGAAAQIEGKSLPFTFAIAQVLWDGSVAGWNEGDHLSRAAAAAGFDLATMDRAIAADPDRYERVIAGNEQDHAKSGHWGVPTFVFENEPFFGQDRIDLLVWRMESRGLTRRKRC